MSKKQQDRPFHAPFAQLKKRLAPAHPVAPPSRRAETRRAEPPHPAPPACERSDAELWADAIDGVEPLRAGPAVVEAPKPLLRPEPFWHPDLDALRELEALVSGDAPFDVADSDEFIEGRVPGLDPQIIRRLRRGEFAVQGHIDLHGMTREEAKGAVDEFLRKARAAGKRCVLLVHGRGIHSKDQVPILKEALKTWLATNRFGRHVLAFATARPVDGGGGAVYVLLRRNGR